MPPRHHSSAESLHLRSKNFDKSPSSTPFYQENIPHNKKMDLNSKAEVGQDPLSTKEIARIALYFFSIYFASNYVTHVAFTSTLVSSASILAGTSGFFTLILGRLAGVEKITFFKTIAVLISVGGVLLMGIPMFFDQASHLTGNCLALTGALLYGFYSVFLKRVCGDEGRLSMPILFAFGGLYTLLFGWIVILGLHFSGTETFELPPNYWIASLIVANMFFGALVPSYLWSVAFQCTSPLIVAIGISFSIPISIAVELLSNSKNAYSYLIFRIISGVFVILGFIFAGLADAFPLLDSRCYARFLDIFKRRSNPSFS
jgi:solute carrier family 35 protein F5